MLLSDSLEVAIGLTFLFTLFSMVLTSINELIEARAKSRSQSLFDGIGELLDDGRTGGAVDAAETAADVVSLRVGRHVADRLYEHPLIQGLMRGNIAGVEAGSGFMKGWQGAGLPAYVPARNFALALIGQALAGKLAEPADPKSPRAQLPTSAPPVEQLRFAAERITNAQVRGLLLQATAVAGDDLDAVRAHLEGVYNGAMDRVSGKYKRRTQRIIFAVGLFLAVAMNINTITITASLSQDATLRRAIVAQASAINETGQTAITAQDAVEKIRATGLPVGWGGAGWERTETMVMNSPAYMGVLQIALGFLLTAFAGALGAPFWFDVLNRLMVIRATVKPTEKSRDEAPQDPQPAAARTGAVVVVQTNDQPRAAPAGIAVGPRDAAVFADPGNGDLGMWEDDGGEPIDGDSPEREDEA